MSNYPHKFDLALPLFPNHSIGELPGTGVKLEMDGRQLEGVTGLCIKAGSNGFTNIAVEFEAGCAVRMTAELIASLGGGDQSLRQLVLANVYRKARSDIDADLERDGDTLETDTGAQAAFVTRIIEVALERIKSL